jgi:hypothetical protein
MSDLNTIRDTIAEHPIDLDLWEHNPTIGEQSCLYGTRGLEYAVQAVREEWKPIDAGDEIDLGEGKTVYVAPIQFELLGFLSELDPSADTFKNRILPDSLPHRWRVVLPTAEEVPERVVFNLGLQNKQETPYIIQEVAAHMVSHASVGLEFFGDYADLGSIADVKKSKYGFSGNVDGSPLENQIELSNGEVTRVSSDMRTRKLQPALSFDDARKYHAIVETLALSLGK